MRLLSFTLEILPLNWNRPRGEYLYLSISAKFEAVRWAFFFSSSRLYIQRGHFCAFGGNLFSYFSIQRVPHITSTHQNKICTKRQQGGTHKSLKRLHSQREYILYWKDRVKCLQRISSEII